MSNARFGKQFVTFEWTLNDNCGPAFWPGFLIRFRHGAHTHTHRKSRTNVGKEEQREILLNSWAGFISVTAANVGNYVEE